ncbi:arsenate reductase [Thauera linaloolentis]|uniref:Arsenate reductase n=1 Tax=Thauera linaloolentis (strain DSM 12138 / JCM 21573 / CCUG 41526 / CIP 105981 / IAM 15112 / NBRC 102519 / 47Lol) TaxID=1123367 RepID=N6Z487_THAL4|nr:arsenate reductase [Thauera linaloolentis]ENO86919.1 arsenate reductase [Thauera linaloolentis 47Lol = DSM 12138]MCM8566662.1 arsenate reductase [Thauera linaloolentis]
MKPVIHGIKHCDTMKKAFAWFDATGVAYDFHDYKKSGIDAATLARWCGTLGWEALVNKRGTTWRKLSPEQQAIATTADAIALMQAQTSLIRRPVVETAGGGLIVGFDPERFAAAFNGASR